MAGEVAILKSLAAPLKIGLTLPIQMRGSKTRRKRDDDDVGLPKENKREKGRTPELNFSSLNSEEAALILQGRPGE